MRRAPSALAMVLACAAGCNRSERAAGPLADPEAALAAAQGTPAADSSAPAAGDAASGSPRRWAGTYKVAAGALYVPEEWKIRWRSDDPASGVGEGPLTLATDAESGLVRGTLDGPLGPAWIDGYLAGGGLSASIKRRDPHDHGFAGVLVGKESAGRIEGTLNASPATAGAIRAGTFSLTPAGGGQEP